MAIAVDRGGAGFASSRRSLPTMPRDAPPPAPPTRDVDVERDVVTALVATAPSTPPRVDARRPSSRRDDENLHRIAVRGSHALRDPRARLRTRTELVDALFHELEGRVLDEARARTWDVLTDASTGVGRSLYERSTPPPRRRARGERARGGE